MDTDTKPTHWREVILFGLGLSVFMAVVMAATGVPVITSIVLTAIIAIQSVCGTIIWLLIRRTQTTVLESLGIGIAIGIVLSIIVGLAFRPTFLAPYSWVAIPVVTFLVIAILRFTKKSQLAPIEPLTKSDCWATGLGIAVGLVILTEFFNEQSLEIVDHVNYYLDIPFHEALSNGIANYGPNDSVLSKGDAVRYHWFSHAWSGFNQNWAGASTFVGITRALPLVSLFITVLVGAAWVQRITERPWTKYAIAILVTGSTTIGTAATTLFGARSPSNILGIALTITTVFVVFEYLFSRLPRIALLLIILLAFGNMGAKASAGAALCAGLVGMVFFAWNESETRKRAIAATAAASIGTLAGYIFAISGGSGGLSIGFGPRLDTSGFPIPDLPAMAIAASTIFLLFWRLSPLLPAILGIRSESSEIRAASFTGIAAGLAGLVAALTLVQPGLSQFYFLWGAYPLLLVAAVCGLAEMLSNQKVLSKLSILLAALGGIITQVGVALWSINSDLPPLLGIFIVWGVAIVLALVSIIGKSQSGPSTKRYLSTFIAVAVISAVGTAGIQYGATSSTPKRLSKYNPGLTTADDIEAGQWLRDNGTDARIATNRFCFEPTFTPGTCHSVVFTVSALSQKRLLVEGYSYAIGTGPLPQKIKTRIKTSTGFVDNPSCRSGKKLWREGVRFVWVNLDYTNNRHWEPYATKAFETPTVIILRLNDLSCYR